MQSYFDKFSNYTILVVGDVMVDSYLFGRVERISPEAPVPVLAGEGRENRLGGAANVARNVQALGARPVLCSLTGRDANGQALVQLMQEAHMPTEGILDDPQRMTTTKTRIISNKQQLLRIDREDTAPLSGGQEEGFIRHIRTLFKDFTFHAVIFEDYDKGVITPAIIREVVALAQAHHIPTLVDPKARNFFAYKGVSLFKPNFKEMKEGLKTHIAKGDRQAIKAAAQSLKAKLNARYIFVTLSEHGVFLLNDGEHHALPAEIREITDVSGAGDTVISIAALSLAAGMPPRQMAALCNLGGGLVCEKSGVVPIDKDMLLKEAKNYFG